MEMTRRDAAKMAGALIVSAVAAPAFGQGQDLTRDKIPTRLPLDEFVKDDSLVAAFRRGVRAMKARKPSDPLSWFFQASIHGVTIDLIRNAAVADPELIAVDQKKYWNQCPHFGQASANFLPWHRAYTHYFERILRAHTGDPRFSLPYWDYSRPENYYFPREFGIQEIDPPLDGDSENPFYHQERNIYFCDWQHWSDPNYRPYSQLTPEAVDWSRARNSPVFFGKHERDGLAGNVGDEDSSSRGLLESFPHDPIHRLVGGLIPRPPLPNPADPAHPILQQPVTGGMAFPPTAAFDPVFCVHHSNLDRLWAEWSCLPGKQWGNFPPQAWFDDNPWTFFDVTLDNGVLKPVEVSRPRKDYFDYRALGISFKSEDLSATPLKLPDPLPAPGGAEPGGAPLLLSRIESPSRIRNGLPTRIAMASGADGLRTPFAQQSSNPAATPGRLLMRLSGINLDTVNATGFEVHLVRSASERPKRGDPSFVGTIALFRHDGAGSGNHSGASGGHHGAAASGQAVPSDTFDVTDVVRAANETDPSRMFVVIVPYSLSATTDGSKAIVETGQLSFDRIEFFSRN